MITYGTILIAVITLCCKFYYKIKCDEITCCYGLCNIKRNIEEELKVDEENKSDDIPTPQIPSRFSSRV
jgi:hypothetical protein